MANAMRKMGIYLGLVEDDEDHHIEDYDDDDAEAEPAPIRAVDRSPVRSVDRFATRPGRSVTREHGVPDSGPTTGGQAAPVPGETSTAYRITTLHPRNYNEARTIGEHFREGVPVIMNLTEMNDSDAKRLVDFAAGLSFGLRGSIERVTNKVFLLSPVNIEVTAEDKARIAENGFFNQS